MIDYDITTFDIQSYLQDRGVKYKTKGENIGRGWIGIDCPFPGCYDDNKHLGISLKSNKIKCYFCGKKGTILDLIQQIEECGFGQAVNIARQFSSDFTPSNNRDKGIGRLPPYTGNVFDVIKPQLVDYIPSMHINYLKSRNFDPDIIIPKYNLKATYNIGDYRWRLICPVTFDRKMVSWVGMDVTRQAYLRYKNCPLEFCKIPTNHTLYNFDSVKSDIIVVEGVTDVWRVGDGAVATFTNNFSIEQIKLMVSRKIKRAFVMYDRDPLKKNQTISQAEIKQDNLAHQLAGIIPYVTTITLDKGDPADMTEDEVKDLRRDIFGKE